MNLEVKEYLIKHAAPTSSNSDWQIVVSGLPIRAIIDYLACATQEQTGRGLPRHVGQLRDRLANKSSEPSNMEYPQIASGAFRLGIPKRVTNDNGSPGRSLVVCPKSIWYNQSR
jgi:hypothetical protein